MDDDIMQRVRLTLSNYLEDNHLRKTPERFAILEAIYGMNGHFTLEELGEKMEQENFRVSRATLYNAIRLFQKLRLVVKHNLHQETRYETVYHNEDHCHQICTICGKVKEVNNPTLQGIVQSVKLRRFHQSGYTLYIYGVCSTCQSKMTRLRNKAKLLKIKS